MPQSKSPTDGHNCREDDETRICDGRLLIDAVIFAANKAKAGISSVAPIPRERGKWASEQNNEV
jgi:hypothetical protein